MDVIFVDKLIKGITKNEDAAQDVWVKILEDGIEDVNEIKNIATKRKVGHVDYMLRGNAGFLPAMPLEPILDGGFTEEIVINLRNRIYKPKCVLRCIDIQCRYCGSEYIYQYGRYKSKKHYWCRQCKRKFSDKSFPFHKKVPQTHLDLAILKRAEGKTIGQIRRELGQIFNHYYSTQTIWRWTRQ